MSEKSDFLLPTQAASVSPFNLGPWTVHPALNRISATDKTEGLEPRMMHVLVCLAAVPGQVISRQRLLETAWPDIVVGEEALTRSVSRLRVLLGDDTRNPQYIETIRGGGYRLLATVEAVADPQEKLTSAKSTVQQSQPPKTGQLAVKILMGFLALAIVASAAFLLSRTQPDMTPPEVLTASPFTTYPGNESFPVYAPDGVTVAFAWSGPEGQKRGLFLKQRDNEEPRRLTQTDYWDLYPSFSPDGTTLAFARVRKDGCTIETVSVLGGATRQLAELSSSIFGLHWSPIDSCIAFASFSGNSKSACLQKLNLNTLQITDLTTVNTATHTGDSWPVYAPDGKSIAFARCDHAGLRDVWLVDATGGPGKQVTTGLNRVEGLVWLPNGHELVTVSSPEGKVGLWKIDITTGQYSWLPTTNQNQPRYPAISPNGTALVFTDVITDYDILCLKFNENNTTVNVTDFAVSTRNEYSPTWSSDGQQVAFVSDRSGDYALWVASDDGSSPRRLKSWPGCDVNRPIWSPDNRFVGVTIMDSQCSWVEVIDSATAKATSLRSQLQHQRFCGWSNDGNLLSVLLDEGPQWQMYRISLDESTKEKIDIKLERHPWVVVVSDVYWYLNPTTGSIWRTTVSGAKKEEIFSQEEIVDWLSWEFTESDLFVTRRTKNQELILQSVDLETKAIQTIAHLPDNSSAVHVSPGKSQALISVRNRVESDLMILTMPQNSQK